MGNVNLQTDRLLRYNVIVGLLGWLAILVLRPMLADAFASPLPLLLLFAVLVITPLALSLAHVPGQDKVGSALYASSVAGQLPAALLAVVSIWQQPGLAAAVFAAPWVLLTFLLAAYGFLRLLSLPPRIEEVVINFGLMYTGIGGLWLLASRAGIGPFGFGEPIVTLTAIHFHYISLGALVLTGMVGRHLQQSGSTLALLYRVATGGMIVGPPLVALGITFSVQLEAVATVLLTFSLVTIAILSLLKVVPQMGFAPAGILLALSSSAVLFSMFFASAYALGRLTGLWSITISTMIQVHGWVNAFGFAFCGLLAWISTTSVAPALELESTSPRA